MIKDTITYKMSSKEFKHVKQVAKDKDCSSTRATIKIIIKEHKEFQEKLNLMLDN